MKIYSINSSIQTRNYQNTGVRRGLRNEQTTEQQGQISQPSFKGGKGFGIGSVLTGCACLLGTSAIAMATLSNPIGWGAAAALYFGSVGASAAGGYAGHKIEDAIKKNKNHKE